MIVFETLTIEGLRSFQKEQRFILARKRRSGAFVLVAGENGVGKSSIWDGVTWVLFGKTARGLRGKVAANWGCEMIAGSLALSISGERILISRSWNPISLTITRGDHVEQIEQHDLEALLGFDYDLFLNTVLLGQFNLFFFDLGPTEKLKLFSTVLDLDNWLAASSEARSRAKRTQEGLAGLEVKVSRLKGRLETLREQRESIKGEPTTSPEDLALLEEKLAEHRKTQEAVDARLAAVKAKLGETEGKRKHLGDQIALLDKEKTKLQASITRAKFELSKSEEPSLKNKLHFLREAVCYACGKPVDLTSDGVKLQVAGLKKELALARKEDARLEELLQDNARALAEIESSLPKLVNTLAVLDDGARERTQSLSKLTIDKNDITAWIRDLELKIKGIVEKESERSSRLKEIRRQISETKEERDSIQAQISEESLLLSRLEFWVSGFKELRLWIVDQALAELEVCVNNALMELGLDGWRVGFVVERASQSGSVIKGFHVEVFAPDAPEGVPWEAWSGGETQRLRIAGALGLSTLIRSRRGFDCSLEVWDEPTAHLNQQGIVDLLSFFESRARLEGKFIFFVDHRSLDAGSFDEEVRVVKGKSGTLIKQSGSGGWNE